MNVNGETSKSVLAGTGNHDVKALFSVPLILAKAAAGAPIKVVSFFVKNEGNAH